jgi:hypothetical protein
MTPESPQADRTVTTSRVTMPDPHRERLDPVFLTLLAATVMFAVMAVAISKWSPNDGQTFQLICGLTTGFAGACLGRVKPSSGGSVATRTTTEPAQEPK